MRNQRGKPSEPRLRASTSQALRKVVDSLGLSHADLAKHAGKRERWLDDAFGRRDRVSGDILPILERDASELIRVLDRIGRRYPVAPEIPRIYAKIVGEIEATKSRREREERVADAVPFLIMDDAVETFADALLGYLQHRGYEPLPSKKLIVEFFSRVALPNAEPRQSYMQDCGLRFSLDATARLRRKLIRVEEEQDDVLHDPSIQLACAVALWETWPQADKRCRKRANPKSRPTGK